jgi:DnaJ-class molecular chaperone
MNRTDPWKTCLACNGKGGFNTRTAAGQTTAVDCSECEGTGSVWFDHTYEHDEDPSAPDTWKEAEGIA